VNTEQAVNYPEHGIPSALDPLLRVTSTGLKLRDITRGRKEAKERSVRWLSGSRPVSNKLDSISAGMQCNAPDDERTLGLPGRLLGLLGCMHFYPAFRCTAYPGG
jgi:hypothetical protein